MNLLQIMAFMAENNLDISRADTFVEGKSVKQGANITMGASMKDLRFQKTNIIKTMTP